MGAAVHIPHWDLESRSHPNTEFRPSARRHERPAGYRLNSMLATCSAGMTGLFSGARALEQAAADAKKK